MNDDVAFSVTLKGEKHCFDVPEVMGILNVTPDSFYEGSRKQTECDIAERANQIVAEGGTMIDVGAFSTRPGASEVTEEEEMRRLRMALAIVRREQPEAIVSVDTFRPDVARMCVEEFGADIINDVSEGGITGIVDTPLEKQKEEIPAIFSMVARLKVPYILMSVQPDMKTMTENFGREVAMLHSLGHEDIILDPGYGFGKSIDQNYEVLRNQKRLLDLGLPLLVGVSRKRMIWQLLDSSAAEALNGTSVVNAMAVANGAHILRVHDVREAVETIKIVRKCYTSE